MRTIDKILFLLAQQHKSQKSLTDYLNISKGVFTDWKSGKNTSYKKHIDKIAEFFGVSTDYLLGVEEQKNPLPENEERIRELYELTEGLNEQDISMLRAFVAGLKANRKSD